MKAEAIRAFPITPVFSENAVIIEVAREPHVRELAPRLRRSDIEELEAQLGLDPSVALDSSFSQSSACWAVSRNDGTVIAMFGVVPSPRQLLVGQAWFVGSPDLYQFRRQWVRLSKSWLGRVFDEFEVLFNVMDDRNKTERRWVEWMGFEFLSLDPSFGPQKRPFWLFAKCRDEASRQKHTSMFDQIRNAK